MTTSTVEFIVDENGIYAVYDLPEHILITTGLGRTMIQRVAESGIASSVRPSMSIDQVHYKSDLRVWLEGRFNKVSEELVTYLMDRLNRS